MPLSMISTSYPRRASTRRPVRSRIGFVIDDEDARVSPGRDRGTCSLRSAPSTRGKYREMVVPTPGVLVTSMYPSCSLTTPWTMASPRPDPEVSCARFLVKNGSKTWPSSWRLDAAAVVGDGQHRVAAGRNDFIARARLDGTSTRALLTTTSPFPAIDSTALRIRLSTALASCDSDPRTTSGVGLRSAIILTRDVPASFFRRTAASCWPNTI